MTESTPSVPEKTDFRPLSYEWRLRAAQAASYMPYGLFVYGAGGAAGLAASTAVIGGLYAAIRMPYAQKAIRLAGQPVMHGFIARGRYPAPADIQAMSDDLCRAAGMSPVPVIMYKKGRTKNAMAMIDRIYVAEDLAAMLTRDELRHVMAHEISHLKTKDSAEIYLTWPPYLDGILKLFAAVTVAAKISPGMALYAGAAYGMYTFLQAGLGNYVSRVLEKRADRNAIFLTRDFNAAIGAMRKIGSTANEKTPPLVIRMTDTHPRGTERIANLKKAFEEASAGQPGAAQDEPSAPKPPHGPAPA